MKKKIQPVMTSDQGMRWRREGRGGEGRGGGGSRTMATQRIRKKKQHKNNEASTGALNKMTDP